jgi:hypothetical protein
MTGWSANSLSSISFCFARMSIIIPRQFRFDQLPMKFEAQYAELRSNLSRRPISNAVGTLTLPAYSGVNTDVFASSGANHARLPIHAGMPARACSTVTYEHWCTAIVRSKGIVPSTGL